ncbi:MAG: hypothetical protein JRF33_26275 [Deltaproteobacteria bacterium]|nr:hypothetical protein [Deltaproteobacteria bacterium]
MRVLSLMMTLVLLAGCNIFLDGYREEGAPCKTSNDCAGDLECNAIMECEQPTVADCDPSDCEASGGTCELVGLQAIDAECVPGDVGHMDQNCYLATLDGEYYCFESFDQPGIIPNSLEVAENVTTACYCIPDGLARWAQPCWQEKCTNQDGELWCLPLEGEGSICAAPDTGIHNRPCFLGRCGVGMSCRGGTCVVNGGGGEEAVCAFEIQCQAGLFCDFAIPPQCTATYPESPHGEACDLYDSSCNTLTDDCREFWGDLPFDPDMPGRCVPTCSDTDDCGDWGGCIFDTEFTGLNASGHCGFGEWTNHYGVKCSGTCLFGGEDYFCATATFLNEMEEEQTVQFCTTECNDACPPGWDCCDLDNSGHLSCAPPLMCGLKPCEDASDCNNPLDPNCIEDGGLHCTRPCSETEVCPVGAHCGAGICFLDQE